MIGSDTIWSEGISCNDHIQVVDHRIATHHIQQREETLQDMVIWQTFAHFQSIIIVGVVCVPFLICIGIVNIEFLAPDIPQHDSILNCHRHTYFTPPIILFMFPI